MFCPNCGNPMSEEAVFCSRCGYQVSELQEQPVYQAAPQPDYGSRNYGAGPQAAPAYSAPVHTAPGEDISPAVRKVLIILAAAALGCRLLGMLIGGTPAVNVVSYCIIPLGGFLASAILMNRAPLVLAAAAEVFLTIRDTFDLPLYIDY